MKVLVCAVTVALSVAATAAAGHASQLCLADTDYCNDIKLILPSIGKTGVYPIKGVDYGCGKHVPVTGVLLAENGIWHISMYRNGVNTSDNPFMLSTSLTYNPLSGTGSYRGFTSIPTDSWALTGTVTKDVCPLDVAAFKSGAIKPDQADQQDGSQAAQQ